MSWPELRILGQILGWLFVAILALGCAVLAAGAAAGCVGLVVLAVEHGLWFVPAGAAAAWAACLLIAVARA